MSKSCRPDSPVPNAVEMPDPSLKISLLTYKCIMFAMPQLASAHGPDSAVLVLASAPASAAVEYRDL